jgi:hypothetical protein
MDNNQLANAETNTWKSFFRSNSALSAEVATQFLNLLQLEVRYE